jgi:hypothetical protein
MRCLTQKLTPLIHLWYVCEPALLAEIISGVQALEKRQGYNSEISLGVLFLRPSKFRDRIGQKSLRLARIRLSVRIDDAGQSNEGRGSKS